jgi:hypothetical protein
MDTPLTVPAVMRCQECEKSFEPTRLDEKLCPRCEVFDRQARAEEAAWRAKQEAEQVEHVRSFGDHDAAVDAAWGAGR